MRADWSRRCGREMGLTEMKMTMIEKLIAAKVGHAVKPGDIVTVGADRVMLDDIMMPFIAAKFEEMGFQKLWDPEKVVIICDHLVPASQVDDIRAYKLSNEFAAKYGVPNLHRRDGICHQLMTEAGYVKPGDLVFGTDSHTTTYGCVGAFSTGIGYTEMAAVLGTGEIWLRVPETIRIEINGKLPANVMSKDVILRIIGDLTAAGATYRALEFTGDTVEAMSLSSRMTMANMGIEAGAKCALFAPDEKTAAYLGIELTEAERALAGDADAPCERVLRYRAEDFVPVMALPSNVDHVAPVKELEPVAVDQVFLGSCTNGRLEDLMAAAEVLKGKHIAPFVKLIVTPASAAAAPAVSFRTASAWSRRITETSSAEWGVPRWRYISRPRRPRQPRRSRENLRRQHVKSVFENAALARCPGDGETQGVPRRDFRTRRRGRLCRGGTGAERCRRAGFNR